ncbi:hypothetical protein RLOC_00013229 [Lonchura striata]|uniref:Uncharacterized protein n=1 Tax=Lonchura striata TaxID=40157 RepID=A0A218UID8_9PASE|nr:hypothetical protein RLOC_00013229 [Lonchura striata domestica]
MMLLYPALLVRLQEVHQIYRKDK